MDKKTIFLNILKRSGMLHLLKLLNGSGILNILMYHRIINNDPDFPYYLEGIAPDKLEKQMQFLSKNYSVISLEEAVERIEKKRKLPPNAIAITIDDGYNDCYKYAYPIFKKYGIPATIFLTTDNISSSKPFWVDRVGYLFKNGNPIKPYYESKLLGKIQMGQKGNNLAYMEIAIQKLKTISESDKNSLIDELQKFCGVSDEEFEVDYNLTWPQIREMSKNDINFGAHTVTHPITTRVSLDRAEWEIIESKKRIELEIQKPVYGFCYPNGNVDDFNDSIISLLDKNGFKYAVTTIYGSNKINSELFKLKRIQPNFNGDLLRLDCVLAGAFRVVNKVKRGL